MIFRECMCKNRPHLDHLKVPLGIVQTLHVTSDIQLGLRQAQLEGSAECWMFPKEMVAGQASKSFRMLLFSRKFALERSKDSLLIAHAMLAMLVQTCQKPGCGGTSSF